MGIPDGPETLDEQRERLGKLQAIFDPERTSEIAEKSFYNLCEIETAHKEGREPRNIFPECPKAWTVALGRFQREQIYESFKVHRTTCSICQDAREPAQLCEQGKEFEQNWRSHKA